MFALMWIPFLGSFMMLLEVSDDGWQRFVVLLVAVAGNDTGALFSGMAWGKHKLAPRVSPKKTWEGAIGGVTLGVIVAALASYFFFDGQWWIGAAVGFAAAVASIIGDLAESALKRDMDVKDMSGIIPGHGGILDRIDSLLVAGPAAYVVFAILM
jgi:phosphatidate cytidylyltransferase